MSNKDLINIHPVDPNKHPLPDLKLSPPTKAFSSLKDEPAVSGSNSADGDGVLGETSNIGIGVHGIGHAGAGVLGECNAGRGVAGISKTGIGVYGKGERLAGLFDGDVEITGNLTIQGVSIQTWLNRVIQLEQEVIELRSRPSSGSTTSGGATSGGTASPLTFDVSFAFSSVQNMGEFTISGSGFTPNGNAWVTTKYFYKDGREKGSEGGSRVEVNSLGKFSFTISRFCDGDTTYEFSAEDKSTGRFTSKIGKSC